MHQSRFTILSWNVCGLGDVDKCKHIFSEIIAIEPSVALLQETKLDFVLVPKLNSFLPRTLDQVVSLPAIGFDGGIFSVINPLTI